MMRHSSTATFLVLTGLVGILAVNPALGETLRFALSGDGRSNFDGTGVNDQAVTTIAKQISQRGDIQFVLYSGDLQCGEDALFNPAPDPPLPNPPAIPTQLASFTSDLLAGGLRPYGTPGTSVPVYCIRGNHETFDKFGGDPLTAWHDAFGQYLPQNGPTALTSDKHISEVGMTYSFTSNNSLFIGIDEYAYDGSDLHPTVNTAWVQQQIAARSTAEQQGFIFTYGHTPLYQIGEVGCLAASPTDRTALLNALFAADGPGGYGARVYICGHDHLNAIARIDGPGGKPFYQVMIGGGGGPIEPFDGVYSKDYPLDRGKATDLYHDSDPDLSKNLPFHYSYATFGMDGDSLWLNLYGSTSSVADPNNWPLLFSLVINGSMTTTATELSSSAVCNDAQVIFDQQTDGTYSGVMQGFGNVLKTGHGTLELTGANTYQGGTIIEEGKLSVNNTTGSGTGSGSVLVLSGGTLGGSGTISGNVTNQGAIAPGNSIGTLTINGNYVHRSDAVYDVELNAAGSSDRIHVGVQGTADLQGGTVRVLPEPGTYLNGTRYTILSADGGVTGTFHEVIQPSAILHFDLDTQAFEVDLVLHRNTYASQAANAYQAAVGGALDLYPMSGSGDMQNVLNWLEMTSQEELRLALNDFGPMLYDDMTAAALSSARVFSNTLRNRFGEIHCSNDAYCPTRNQAWVRSFSNWSSEAGNSTEQPGYRYTLSGGAVGMERHLNEEFLGGMSIGYSNAGLAEYNSMGGGDLNTLHTALYTTWRRDTGMYADAALGWGYDWFKNTRQIHVLDRTANSEHTGQEFMAYFDTGFSYPVGNWTIGPLVAIQYTHVDQNHFQEQNADDFGLLVNANGANSLQTRIGLDAARPLSLFEHRLTPRVRVEWLHEYCGSIRTIPARFSGMPDVVFSAPGRQYKTDGAIVSGGFDACLADNVTAYFNYDLPLMGDSNTISGYSLWAGIGVGY